MGYQDYTFTGAQEAAMTVANGSLADAPDVNTVWETVNTQLALITTDMEATSIASDQAYHWATDAVGVEPDAVNNPGEYSAYASASAASDSATSAASSAATATSSANFEGTWVVGTTYTLPTSVYYNGTFWQQLTASSTGDEPGVEVGGNWVAIPQGINDNLLINSWFQVNQRKYTGASALPTGSYGHDVWRGRDVDPQWTVTAGVVQMIGGKMQQRNDDMIANAGKVVTFSVLTGSCSIEGGGVTGTVVVTPGSPHTFTMDGDFLWIGYGTETFSGPKLELGSVATEYVIPKVTDEQLRCYRYYYDIGGGLVGSGFNTAGSSYIMVKTPVMMSSQLQTAVTLPSGMILFDVASVGNTPINITVVGGDANSVILQVLTSTTPTNGPVFLVSSSVAPGTGTAVSLKLDASYYA